MKKIGKGRYGNLLIKLTDEGKSEFDHFLSLSEQEALGDLFEDWCGKGWEWINPEDIGALTSAPIISDDVARDDNGVIIHLQNLWWFPSYETTDPIATLFDKGEVVFQAAPDKKDKS